MAALTGHIHIGVLVNGVLYRDPVTLAKSAATADQISEGRFVFSLGAAWARGEFKPYGLAFPSLAERYGRLEESLEMVKSLAQAKGDVRGPLLPCGGRPLWAEAAPVATPTGHGGRDRPGLPADRRSLRR